MVPNAGQSILAGNVWVNGTSVDYYGVALDLVFADNTLALSALMRLSKNGAVIY